MGGDVGFKAMDKKQAIEIAKKYKSVVAEHLPLKALYLFGSYSKGNHTEDTGNPLYADILKTGILI